jgi:hypothetical protein
VSRVGQRLRQSPAQRFVVVSDQDPSHEYPQS